MYLFNGEIMKKTMVLILSLLMTTVSFSQTDLTLENSIQIALQRNSALVKANYNLESSKASVKSAYGNLIPTLGVSASWGWGKTEGNLGTSDGASSYRINAGGSVVLFDGLANYANISSAEDDFEAAELGIDRFKRDIVQTTTIFYYTILKSKALLKVKEENFKYNNKLLETITERNKLGSAPVADLYAQQVQAGGAEVEMIIAQNSVDAAQNTLIDYLSLDVLKEYNFVSKIDTVNDSNIEYYNKDFNDILTMVDYALLNRTDYLGQQKTLSSASEGITVAKGGFWPSLSGDYGVGNTDIAIDDVFNQRTWSVGLSVNFPIFSNFNTETSVQSDRAPLIWPALNSSGGRTSNMVTSFFCISWINASRSTGSMPFLPSRNLFLICSISAILLSATLRMDRKNSHTMGAGR